MKNSEQLNLPSNIKDRYFYLFLSILLLALITRLYGLGYESYWFDEFIAI